MRIFLLGTLLFASAATAKVETVQTLMPGAGQSELTPMLMYSGGLIKLRGATGQATSSSGLLVGKYFYGLTANHAVGARLGYASATTKSDLTFEGLRFNNTSKSQGLGDITFGYKGNYDFAGPTIYWGAGYVLSPEIRKREEVSASDVKSNQASGQNAVDLQVAAVMPVSAVKIGGQVEYTIRENGKREDKSPSGVVTKSTLSKGDSAAFRIFAEFETVPFRPNVALATLRTYTSESRSESGTVSTSSGTDLTGLEFSARAKVAPGFEIIPDVRYYTLQNGSSSGLEKAEVYYIGASGRFLF